MTALLLVGLFVAVGLFVTLMFVVIMNASPKWRDSSGSPNCGGSWVPFFADGGGAGDAGCGDAGGCGDGGGC